MTTATVERQELQQMIQKLSDERIPAVLMFVKEEALPRVPPEIEDAAFQALALENAESWL